MENLKMKKGRMKDRIWTGKKEKRKDNMKGGEKG